MRNPLAFLTHLFNRKTRTIRKSNPPRTRPLSLLHLEDRITPTSGISWLPTEGGTYSFTDPTNWSGGSVPVSDHAVIDATLLSGSQIITVDSSVALASLTVLGDPGSDLIALVRNGGTLTSGSTQLDAETVALAGGVIGNAGPTTVGGNLLLVNRIVTSDFAFDPSAAADHALTVFLTSSNIFGTNSYSHIHANGDVTLAGAQLNVNIAGQEDFLAAIGQQFIIIHNETDNPTVGTFAGLEEGDTIAVDGYTLQISYVGDDGNDVVLTILAGPPVYHNATFSVPENSPVGTVVGTAAATDSPGQAVSYQIIAGNTSDAFAIDGTGQITVNTAVLDYEVQSTYTLTVRATDNGSVPLYADATITINVTDRQTYVSISNVSWPEFNGSTWGYEFIVTSSSAIGVPFTVTANTEDGTAEDGSDYTAVSKTLSFTDATATTPQKVTVMVFGDTLAEATEYFLVLLSSTSNDVTFVDNGSFAGAGVGVGTIVNDDVATFTIDDVTVSESAGSVTLPITLSTPLDTGVWLYISFANGSTTNDDYNAAVQTVYFPAGSTSQSFTITGLNDKFAEADETFTVKMDLSNAWWYDSKGYSIDATAVATVTIIDDDTTAVLPATGEGTASAGVTVASILGPTLAGKGMAVVAVENVGGRWQYQAPGTTTWVNFTTSNNGRINLAGDAHLLSDTYKIRFVATGSFNGTASIVYRVWDRTSGTAGTVVNLSAPSSYGNDTAYSADTSSARITITPRNDAPELLFGHPVLTPVAVNSTSPNGDRVEDIAGYIFHDIDGTDPVGIAINGLVGTNNGTWQYSLNGGASWTNIGTVNNRSALLLSADDRVRFVPKAGFTGAASFTFRAWDGSNGAAPGSRGNVVTAGGRTPYSWMNKTATVRVLNNSAPTLTLVGPQLSPILEDGVPANNTGTPVNSLLDGFSDSGATGRGIAIVSIDNTNGNWQYTTNNGGTWLNISNVRGRVVDLSASALMLANLPANKVRFVPNRNYSGTATFDFHAWDRSYGTIGWTLDLRQQDAATGGRTAFSTAIDTATITVIDVNDAPVLNANATPTLTQVQGNSPEPQGDTVASFAGPTITDVDANAVKGIAVIAVTGNNGKWQYQLAGTTDWIDIGTVNGTNSALLLRETDTVRFLPDNALYVGTATIRYRAWDQTVGEVGTKVSPSPAGGSGAFSTATGTAYMYSYNDAPVLAPGNPVLKSVTSNEPVPEGVTVDSFAGQYISDFDIDPLKGIAIVGRTGQNGVWEYKLDGEDTWKPVGAVSGTSSLLLRDIDMIRFRPTVAVWEGSATLEYRAWDQTGLTFDKQGTKRSSAATGGRNPFSTARQTLTVRSNIAPVLANAGPVLKEVNGNSPDPSPNLVGDFVSASITDLDDNAKVGIAVTDVSTTGGKWQYSTNGLTWTDFGTVTFKTAVLLRDTDYVRFLPNTTTFNGEARITYRAWDQSGSTGLLESGTRYDTTMTGDWRPFSSVTQTAVARSNKAPQLFFAQPTLPSVKGNSPAPAGVSVGSFASDHITDLDAGALKGIAVHASSGSDGTWQFSVNGGDTWTNFGTVSVDESLLLREWDLVRFLPTNAEWSGTATITYRAWDMTNGTAWMYGFKVSTATTGNPTPFSTGTQTATVRSNNAPVLSGSAPALPTVTSNNPAGAQVSTLIDGKMTDLDSGDARGIAVTGLVGWDGVWEWSSDGTTWTAIGTVNGSQSLLLLETDYIRFRPTVTTWNNVTPTITYRAWDQTSGTAGTKVSTNTSGGVTAFSSGLHTATVVIDLA